MKALVLGATGAVGKDLTALLLDDPLFEVVEVFVRRDPELAHPKLVVHVVAIFPTSRLFMMVLHH